MRLGDCLSPDLIVTNLEVKDKKELFSYLSKKLSQAEVLKGTAYYNKPEKIEELIWKSEKKQTTGLGQGLAFPHARIPDLKRLALVIATLKEPLEYGAIDGKPVTFVCMILAPQRKPTLALKAFSLIAALLSKDEGKRVLNDNDSEKIYFYICSQNLVLDEPIRAYDIMEKPKYYLYPETPLQEVTSLMLKNKANAACVVDKEHRVIGEINCDLLFKFGIPPFINRLKSVSFISDFDPFDKYFAIEGKATAQDLMTKNTCLMNRNASLLEIVFALTVLKYFKIYIVDENKKLLGEINRISVLDRILNL